MLDTLSAVLKNAVLGLLMIATVIHNVLISMTAVTMQT